MANPASGRPRLLRSIAICLLATILLVGLTVLIIWLAVKPKKLIYSVETGQVHELELHRDHVNSTFDIVLRAYNPNKKVSLYYDSIQVSVSYDDQSIAFASVEPFFQPHRNATKLEVKPTARSVPLDGSVSRDLRLEKSSGQIEVEIRVKARIRFKVGAWKSWHYTLRVICSPVKVHPYSPKTFTRKYCDVDI